MKRLIILCALIMIGCSSHDDWDSGGERQDAFEQERMEERAHDVRNQNPGPTF